MTVIRINEFRARAEHGDELYELVSSFVPTISAAAGCRSCRLLRGLDDPTRIVVIEEWDDVESHQRAVREVPTDGLQAAMALLAEPPRGEYLSD